MGKNAKTADRERFSTAARLKVLGEQTAARVYRSQTKRQARRSRLTGRAALLALVMCSLIVALAYPMRQYVSQRSDIADQKRRAADAQKEVEQLRDEKARLQDDAYIEKLAREHLHMQFPGETSFTVVDPGTVNKHREDKAATSRAWHYNLWDGVDNADRPAN
ncbi:septum formation initiator family protein [Streptomyces violascens]|uniref:FtsB family cell division protein n=1 Tax=Streptomyces violascens TaxID=67381 RepID=UPI00364B61C8